MKEGAQKPGIPATSTSEPKKILIIGFSYLHRDARIYRQIEFVKDRYRVWAAGFSDPLIAGITYIPLPEPPTTNWRQKAANLIKLKTRQFDRYYWERYGQYKEILATGSYDIVIANEIESLPIAYAIACVQKAKIVFDAHEYAPREFEDSSKWRFLYMAFRNHLCRIFLPQCHAVTTVCEGIADEYREMFKIACQVITNADDYLEIMPSAVAVDKIRLVHHGLAIPQRRIEVMIDVMKHLDERFTLDLFLVPCDPGYQNKLVKKIGQHQAIRLHPPLAMGSIPKVLNGFDVGIHIIKPINFNNRHSLPNKFFTFIQSRLAIAIGPSVEMAAILKRYDLGIITRDYSAKKVAVALRDLNKEKIVMYKNQAHLAAAELSSAANKVKFLDILAKLQGPGVPTKPGEKNENSLQNK
jgi:hypothetical protein